MKVKLWARDKEEVHARVLFDEGSDIIQVRKDLVHQPGLKGETLTLTLTRVSRTSKDFKTLYIRRPSHDHSVYYSNRQYPTSKN